MNNTKRRCLFYLPGPVAPDSESHLSRFFHLGESITGDVIQTSWNDSAELKQKLETNIPQFKFHIIKYSDKFWMFRTIRDICYFTWKGLSLSRRNGNYDVVACYGLTKTAFSAYLIKLFTGAKLIVEVPCNPAKAFIAEEESPGISTRFKFYLAQLFMTYLFKRVDGLRTLYPSQIDGYKKGSKTKVGVFHEFLPIECLQPSETDENFVMLLGFPWYRKGFDILINAFNRISPDYPELGLKIVGYISEEERDRLIRDYVKGNTKIEFIKPMPWLQVMDMMSRCKFLVLSSRSEAMGRVWLEAMALGKPVICSSVDGVPHYVKHLINGLLFKSEDVEGLADSMQLLLKDPALAKRLSNEGYRYAHEELNEECYVAQYSSLIEEVIEETGVI